MVIILLLITVAFIDVRSHKIPNLMTVMIMLAAILSIAYDILLGHVTVREILLRIVTAILIILFLFPFFSVGAIGAGDVKLILAASIAMESPWLFLLITFLTAALFSLGKLIWGNNLKERILKFRLFIKSVFLYQSVTLYEDSQTQIKEKLKYNIHLSVPILIASCICLWGKIVK